MPPTGVAPNKQCNGYDKLSRRNPQNPTAVLESLEYTYDSAGNVASRVDQRLEQETGYSYDALNRLTEFNPPGEGATAYGYDAAGNRTEAGGTTYTFNALNQATESSTGTTYSYDGAGRLAAEVSGPEETTYGWDAFDHLDGHGDVTAVSSPAGAIESRQNFDPWGNQLSGPSLEMGYLGAWERPSDSATGLIQMGARSYAPSMGAFVSEDPVLGHLGISVSANRYPYAWDNPVNRFDLSGREVPLGMPIFIAACGPSPEEVSDRAHDFAKRTSGIRRWLNNFAIGTGECAYEGVLNGRYKSPCHDAYEEFWENLEELGEGLEPEDPEDPKPPIGPFPVLPGFPTLEPER